MLERQICRAKNNAAGNSIELDKRQCRSELIGRRDEYATAA
jgi:hypothetical protein